MKLCRLISAYLSPRVDKLLFSVVSLNHQIQWLEQKIRPNSFPASGGDADPFILLSLKQITKVCEQEIGNHIFSITRPRPMCVNEM